MIGLITWGAVGIAVGLLAGIALASGRDVLLSIRYRRAFDWIERHATFIQINGPESKQIGASLADVEQQMEEGKL